MINKLVVPVGGLGVFPLFKKPSDFLTALRSVCFHTNVRQVMLCENYVMGLVLCFCLSE